MAKRIPGQREAVFEALARRDALLWLNPRLERARHIADAPGFGFHDILEAETNFQRWGAVIAHLFPEVAASRGIIESAIRPVERLQAALMRESTNSGRWFIKADHELPIVGSIKARGGFYEVLMHAEESLRGNGAGSHHSGTLRLVSPEAASFFSRHEIRVGSTGNLGLSIGIMAAALGFNATVHMSEDARPWKKTRLRQAGVRVIEHQGDFGEAVAAGRREAKSQNIYFVDDERSATLFLGYSVAALRVRQQLTNLAVVVDEQHPLFVYVPCGVGGSPGGICLGLKHLFGDFVHCFFAEPVESPAMLMRLSLDVDRPISVREIGLDNRTEADGLAVAQASDLSAPLMRQRVSGIFTVPDAHLFEDLYRLGHIENMKIEPSAAAGLRGPQWLLDSEAGVDYLDAHRLGPHLRRASHLIWTTGGSMVPQNEYADFYRRGQETSLSPG